MFELKIALKYLLPKKKSLSTALISLLSVAVISLVVWLVLVFLSVTSGIEKNWLGKLTSLHAPIRLSPTEEYYQSYFYKIDSLASSSNYTLKTVGEKALSKSSDPYSIESDVEIPFYWPKPEIDRAGKLIDPVKVAFAQMEQIRKETPEMRFQDFEIGGALLKLELERMGRTSYVSQMSYLLSLSEQNPRMAELLTEPTERDLAHAQGFVARVENGVVALPKGGEIPILLPKSYRDSKALVGDRGFLHYTAHGASSQEQRIAVRIAGFYDPGFLSLGNKCLIVPTEVTRTIAAAAQTFSPDGTPTNGIFVWPSQLKEVGELKQLIAERLDKAGIGKYWKVDSFEDFEFSKELLIQFRSDKTLFTFLGGVIILVACSNIISLLILLVNDKKKEIAILQSMGATSRSIGAIFAACGIAMGLTACALGGALALITLHHLDQIVAFLTAIQGKVAFNPAFFGQRLPNELSSDALLFVLIATPILSLLAGVIPAVKASRIRPSEILRSE